ncbi:MAG: neuraminidase-like domain-containing protein [Nitrospira sp.]|nr:neuraminidase-like domain-containing protein [Nitrospira sp.]MDH4326911.1 neuraminidase-like domain-containing protein [Nitrospira sp.]
MATSPKHPSKTKPAASKKPAIRGKTATAKSSKDISVDAGETYVVFGAVTNADATPAADLTVIAYDKDESREDRLGQATTDATGGYKIPYREADFRRSPKERGGADVIVRIYNEKNEMLFASKKKNDAPAKYELNVHLPIQQYVVRGTVTDANGRPLPNMAVRAFDRDLRVPQLLGTDETGPNGDYRIEYRADTFQLGDLPSRRAPWLIVEVRESAEGIILAKQEVQRADRDQLVTFTLFNVGGISEWQRISEAVAPLLKGQGATRIEVWTHVDSSTVNRDLASWELTPEDVDFIVQDADLDRMAVEVWVASSRMVREAERRMADEYSAQQGLVREGGWPFFYAIARQRQVKDLDAVLQEPAERLRQAVRAAVSAHQVPPLNEKQVELLLDVLKLLQGLQQLDPERSSDSDFAKLLGNLATPLPKVVALDALAVVQEKGLYDTVALLELAERYPDADAPIKAFVRGVRVHQLTSGHEGLSRVLNARLESASDSIAPLARLQTTEWIGMADEADISAGLALRTQAQVERQHPLTAVESKIHAGIFSLPGVSVNEVAALIKHQPAMIENILLGKTPVKETEPQMHKALRNTGRFMRTGISMELAADLMNAGIETPGKAIRYGRGYIYEQYRERLPEEDVREVVDSFFDVTEKTINGGKGVLLEVESNRHYPSWMMEEYKVPLPELVRENAPTLAALFGDLDECLCRPCDSMLGQPAYLVDLLNLLAKSRGQGGSALDVLRTRRPDIFKLELSCTNAEALVQHIDIVLEILEKAAAPEAISTDSAEVIAQIAYPKLRRAVYPWHLPFDRGYAEVSAYLAKLGVSREKLLGLRRGTVPAHLAAETLHVSIDQAGDPHADSQWELLTQQRLGARLWAAYGFNIDNDIRIVDPASGELLSNLTVEDVLTRASILIDRTGLSLEELEQSLKTNFVAAVDRGIELSNRDQCKTSAMRLPAEGPVLEGILDRLHRFTRLRAQLPRWSIKDLGHAIVVCEGLESAATTDQQRADLLVKLTSIKRLHDDHGLSLDVLLERPMSETRLREALGLSLLQFTFLKEITGYTLTSQAVDWHALEGVCNTAQRLSEIGLTADQAAHALLTRGRWRAVAGELPPSIKSDKQIEELLGLVQQRLRVVVAIRPDVGLEVQAADALNDIYDDATAGKLVASIRDASGPTGTAPSAALLAELVEALSGATDHRLGDWLPLMNAQQATALFSVTATNNFGSVGRFTNLLTAIASRRRERALMAVLVEQCGLAETEVASLLGERLLLDPAQEQPLCAYEAFLDRSFWADVSLTHPVPPSVTATAMPRLHAWMDRLYRLITLSAAVGVDNELMQIADRVAVGSNTGINWRDMLGVAPAASTTAWQNPQWQTLLDLLWLQQPDQLSRPALGELFNRSATPGAQISADTLRPLTARVDIAEPPTVNLIAQALSVSPNTISILDLHDPGKLRLAFQWLLLARHLGADSTQIARLINLADNEGAAGAAKALLEAKLSREALKASLQKIGNALRRQRRDALVAFHTAQVVGRNNSDKWRDAKALYEHFLIDHQMEPCFETTRIIEAITAVQLFAQRILFGIEPEITAEPELKQRWTWMRNYRVWEANRKVFLFPENWLFPELRDDKSSSFKQLESALGQGELTQDLANQAFGQFLDDVATVGQTQVLGMFENVIRAPSWPHKQIRRDLYVVGRTINPPYYYYWRKCFDFGGVEMEWSPWQRVELEIQGDHVLPVLLSGELYLVWPIFRRGEVANGAVPSWEIRMAWSRFNGKSWLRQDTSRELQRVDATPFRDERSGFSFRCEVDHTVGEATFTAYMAAQPIASTFTPPATGAPNILSNIKSLGKDQWWNILFNQLHDFPTASLQVSWRAWIKLKNADGEMAWIELLPGPNCRIQLRRIEDGWKSEMAKMWGASSIPSMHWTLDVVANGIRLPAPQAQETPEIQPPNEHQYWLCFAIDATTFDAKALGFEGLDKPHTFESRLKFVLGRSNEHRWETVSQPTQLKVVQGCRPWMNGYAEDEVLGLADSGVVLADSTIGRQVTVFPTSGRAPFVLLGSASYRSHGEVPALLHFSEGRARSYVDLDVDGRPRMTAFCLYADGFSGALVNREAWISGASLAEAEFQNGDFDASLLPVPGGAVQPDNRRQAQPGGMWFDRRFPYASYNWEIFLHAPLLIADQLSKQHKFEDAEGWLRFVFDPTSSDADTNARRFVKFRVFKELSLSRQVVDDLTALAQVAGGFASDADVDSVRRLIDCWRDTPFRPFVIARRRHIAFLWRTLFAYLDNLIAWADSLYRRDTRESINEATMLYVLAERILGRRPQVHQDQSNRPALTYDENITTWDEFANFWIDVGAQGASNLKTAWRLKDTINQPNPDGMLYFCMPFNDKILSYWNTVDARLSNIRTCRNIEGIQRNLPLMDAPIDPELLIRAAAAGLDLGEVIAGLYAPPPHYRYSILSSRAMELANECKSLGAAMLSAIEKRDAEYLAQLRSSNEISLLKLVRDVRMLQIDEADRNIEALRASRRTITARYAQYQRLLGKKEIKTVKENESAGEDAMLGTVDSGLASNRSNWGLIKEENEQYVGIEGANTWSVASSISKIIGSGFNIAATVVIPNPVAKAAGAHEVLNALGLASSTIGDAFSAVSQGWRAYADQQGMMAGHLRRRDEWAFQSNQTLKELQQIDKQILANQIRIDITKKELDNHLEQIEQAKAVDEVMRSKFSNVQLYEWMKTELSRLYFNAYRMAVDMARRAERAASRELGVKSLNMVRNDHWDSLRDGLLAGERLHQDLKRLEIAYLDQNRREYELTKHISLRRLNPEALVNLRVKDSEGHCRCEFDIPEWLLDLDTPGHYLRRIKSVSVSIPSVTGPYTSVNCKLTLLKSAVRHESSLKDNNRYLRLDSGDDDRFIDYFGATEAIVTSTGTADSGMFETQLRDERFLPFEGAGIISTWRLELPAEYPQFDYSTISDVILTIRYTAREGGDALRSSATASIAELLNPSPPSTDEPLLFTIVLSSRSDFPTEWARAATTPGVKIPITRSVLPYWMDAAGLVVREVHVADLSKVSTSPLNFKTVWTPPSGVTDPAPWPETALNGNGEGEGNLGPVANLTDKILLLYVGVKAT